MSDVELLTLSNGPLNFSARAMGRGPVVLMLHGFPDSLRSFDDQLSALAASGYRAVSVAMRGYEPSSQPADGDYHAIRMVEDVVAWIDSLGAPVHLVGHDWGATIAYGVAAHAPDRLASLTAIAVPHPARFGALLLSDPDQLARSGYIMAFQDVAAEALIRADNWRYLVELWRTWSPGWTISDRLLADMRTTFDVPGVAAAALDWYRQAMDSMSDAATASQALFTVPIVTPTLGLCGDQDGCISADIFTQAMQPADFRGGVTVRRFEGCGHFLHRENSAAVNGALIDWIGSH